MNDTDIKVILAVLRADAADLVADALIGQDFHVTRASSTGGFLRRGNVTLICGVEAGQVEEALNIIRQTCGRVPAEEVHRATIFVLDTTQALQI
jgi:uncharacterized protein YaaQ